MEWHLSHLKQISEGKERVFFCFFCMWGGEVAAELIDDNPFQAWVSHAFSIEI